MLTKKNERKIKSPLWNTPANAFPAFPVKQLFMDHNSHSRPEVNHFKFLTVQC
jgi:hypothetical protein